MYKYSHVRNMGKKCTWYMHKLLKIKTQSSDTRRWRLKRWLKMKKMQRIEKKTDTLLHQKQILIHYSSTLTGCNTLAFHVKENLGLKYQRNLSFFVCFSVIIFVHIKFTCKLNMDILMQFHIAWKKKFSPLWIILEGLWQCWWWPGLMLQLTCCFSLFCFLLCFSCESHKES